MKQKYTILSTLTLFGITIYLALSQGQLRSISRYEASTFSNIVPASLGVFSNAFNGIMSQIASLTGGSVFVSMMILALAVELVLLYPSIQIQLKQKKIHLFHKKLVNRFEAGELSFSKVNQEMDVLYAVNQKIHMRGALLVAIQLLVFVMVLLGLQDFAASASARSLLDSMLLAKPANFLIPLFTSLAYFSHSLIKMGIKQREDYIHPKQMQLALLISVISAGVIFAGSSMFSVLLSVYFVTLVTLGTVRYLLAEKYASKLSRNVRHELINMLKHTKKNHSKLQKWSQKWHHHPVVRHVNFHLLEEAASMSFAFMLMIQFV